MIVNKLTGAAFKACTTLVYSKILAGMMGFGVGGRNGYAFKNDINLLPLNSGTVSDLILLILVHHNQLPSEEE